MLLLVVGNSRKSKVNNSSFYIESFKGSADGAASYKNSLLQNLVSYHNILKLYFGYYRKGDAARI